MQTRTLQVGSLFIACHESSGIGPAVVLVHGNSSSGRAYQHQLESLLGHTYRLVSFDLPGHGQSTNATDPASYSLPGYAEILVGVTQQLLLDSAVFVGWSLGGHIVLEASAQLPDAAGFMIFGTPPIAFPPAMVDAFLPHPAMAASFKADLTEAEMDAYVSAFFKPGTTNIPPIFKADIHRTDGQARAQLGSSIRPDGYRDEVEVVANLTKPLAILHGAHEQLVNVAYMQALPMPTLWRNEIQLVENAGHAPHWEEPAQFNALLEAFIHDCTK